MSNETAVAQPSKTEKAIVSTTPKATTKDVIIAPKGAVAVLLKASEVLTDMSSAQTQLVYSDFGAQLDNFKVGKLDMTNLRQSDKTHQAIVKCIRSLERMVEVAKAATPIEAELVKKA